MPSCPLCAHQASAAFSVGDRNRGIVSRPFDYWRCGSCGTYFLDPVPADLVRHYPPDYHGFPSRSELARVVRWEKPKLKLLRGTVRSGRLLEIGPGAGAFSRAAVLTGFDVTAIEMDAGCCEYIERVVGARAICSDRPELALSTLPPFDVIAMWHVLEHLEDPWAVLEQAARTLAPGGALLVAMPNPQSLQFRLLGRYWAHVDAPRHLYLIPAATTIRKAEQLGLRHVQTTSSDLSGRRWDRFGWEYAIRRHPARRPRTKATWAASMLATAAMSPIEARGLAGTTYTSLFVRPRADSAGDRRAARAEAGSARAAGVA
jgi:2-polyprenyl-3-methyl-5-hydroxy-6-metoxy-1,4-benzoquinol methylase